MTTKPEPVLLCDDARGIYCAQSAMQKLVPECMLGVSDEDRALLIAGPDEEYYYDAWQGVCDDAIIVELPSRVAEISADLAVCRDADQELLSTADPAKRAAARGARDTMLTKLVEDGAIVYTLYQDGNVWLIPRGMEWSDETGFYVWPSDVPAEYHEEFLAGYIECALWCGVISSDEDASENVTDADESDLVDAARAALTKDARDFVESNYADLVASTLDASHAGHDFWLTRNRHGAGFWDRKSLGPVADAALDRLTETSHAHGEAHLVQTEDGSIEIE